MEKETEKKATSVKTEICKSIISVLNEKNKRYGDSALSPRRIFFKGSSEDGILIRLDDKYSRISNSSELRTNDLFDLFGYLVLLSMAKGYNFPEKKPDGDGLDFNNKLRAILNTVYVRSNNVDKNQTFVFAKSNGNLIKIDQLINEISSVGVTIDNVTDIMVNLLNYFEEESITDFSVFLD